MRKFCLRIHRWFALPLGVIMIILCPSGPAILLVRDLVLLFDINVKEMSIYTMVVRLHHWLLMKPGNIYEGGQSFGRVLTAVSATCMSIVLLSGIVIWWPKTKEVSKSRLTVNIDKGLRRFIYDSHMPLGICVSIFPSFMAPIGLVFSFDWYKAGMPKLLGQPMPPKEMKIRQPKDGMKQGGTSDKAFASTSASQMKGQSQTYKEGARGMKGDQHGKKPEGGMFFKQLHTGAWGGWFSRVSHAIVAPIGGFPPTSSYYLWWKRRSTKKKKV